ncbi:hypothetical protein, partial [Enterovibrio nigricans]|uniref:hypothetical protein n=1 Tax=Enterovibrio nigricans TaxID=504469 RepID=UPI000CCB910E
GQFYFGDSVAKWISFKSALTQYFNLLTITNLAHVFLSLVTCVNHAGGFVKKQRQCYSLPISALNSY